MRTKIIKVDSKKPSERAILEAAEVIRSGGLVAFPTETVYGLGANTFDVQAIKKIFIAKGRPSDNPLIVHIAKIDEVSRVTDDFTETAQRLSKLWPGPLTMILKKHASLPSLVTAGLDSVAIRMPDHPVALALIEKAGVPIAAPSANRSGKPSPTKAEHVIQDLEGRIDMILDGGSTRVGVESTVVDITTNPPVLLRPGGVTFEELTNILGEVDVHSSVLGKGAADNIRSPGMKYVHYAPDSELILVEGEPDQVFMKIRSLVVQLRLEGKKVGVLTASNISVDADEVICLGDDPEGGAKLLFDSFRRFNKLKVDVIIAEDVNKQGIGLAIANRLRRASSKIIRV